MELALFLLCVSLLLQAENCTSNSDISEKKPRFCKHCYISTSILTEYELQFIILSVQVELHVKNVQHSSLEY